MIASQSYDPLHYGVLSSDDLRAYCIIIRGICQDVGKMRLCGYVYGMMLKGGIICSIINMWITLCDSKEGDRL